MQQQIKKQWRDISGNAKWATLAYLWQFIAPYLGVGSMLAAGAATYYTLRAYWDSLPDYILAVLFLTIFAVMITLANGIREWILWSKWKREFNTESLMHPFPHGVLWKWDGIQATGPFCPQHPNERLFYQYGPFTLTENFDDRHLGNNGHLVCSAYKDDIFKFLEPSTLKVCHLREQAKARLHHRSEELSQILSRIRTATT